MTEGLRSIVRLGPESLRGIEPAKIGARLPKFEIVDPTTLFVEEAYQRSFSAASIKLIREILADWNWALFKPPVCARLAECGNVLVVFDGQHTATAAACHPQIDKIPVMVVPPESVVGLADRAQAFVGHNTHRISLTQLAIFRAEVAAGNALANIVERAADRADVFIPRTTPSAKDYRAGMTVAVGTLRMIARNVGVDVLARVLSIVRRAERVPLRAAEIAAVALLVAAHVKLPDAELTKIIAGDDPDAWALRARQEGENGTALASNLALAWAKRLKLAATGIKVIKGERSGAQIVKQPPKPMAARPAPPPAKPAGGSAPVTPGGDSQRFVNRNGVMLDLKERKITHRGLTVLVPDDDGIRLVASLARVMPSIMDPLILSRQAFGRVIQDPKYQVKALADRLNPLIASAKLEIKTVPNMGHTLFDLGRD